MEYQGWNLAHYAFSKDALKPTVYYDELLDCTLFFDNKTFHCFKGKDISLELFELIKGSDGTFELASDDTFAECFEYIDFVENACEGDLSKVSVSTLDCDCEPLSELMHVVEDL